MFCMCEARERTRAGGLEGGRRRDSIRSREGNNIPHQNQHEETGTIRGTLEACMKDPLVAVNGIWLVSQWGIRAHVLVGRRARADRQSLCPCFSLALRPKFFATTTTWVHFPLIDFLEIFGSLEMASPLWVEMNSPINGGMFCSFSHRPKKVGERDARDDAVVAA